MGTTNVYILAFLLAILVRNGNSNGNFTERQRNSNETTKPTQQFNSLEKLIVNKNELDENKLVKQDVEDVSESKLRVKRQYGYGRGRYYPIPILVGGFGFPVGGGGYARGFGGRGFGGIGGRGFAGRGFGGRGFGGRGFGGIGGRGVGGFGGRGGGRG